MNEERLHILKMLEEGKITVEEATQLITAVETSSTVDKNPANPVGSMPKIEIAGEAQPRWDVEADETDEAESTGSGLRLPLDKLSGTNFRGAILHGARFEGANLEGANLHDLTGSNLHDADFRGTNLRGKSLVGVDLSGFKYRNGMLESPGA